MSSPTMGMAYKRGYLGVGAVIGLMILTLYMAFAFPLSLFQLRQSETTEIKSVIIIGRSGEKSPSPESYFIGEEPPEELAGFDYEQLTNVGKERMFLLGKFLKLRYYQLLLNGNPRLVKARSTDTDRALESAQALLAGLNPPKDEWFWSSGGDLKDWQPKAVHTTTAASDDMLSMSPNCYRLHQDKMSWKNSSRYQQLLNEFRHDLQTLRSNTGLEFEEDLEMATRIEDSLKTRLAYKADVPAWYTSTFANRLAHIADVSTGLRYGSPDTQRLYVGRLLDEIVERVNARIKLDQELHQSAGRTGARSIARESSELQQTVVRQLPVMMRTQRVLEEPKVFIYMTDKQRLSALLNSLQVYSSQPQFGSLLLIELHYDPINHLHFLRLYTISSNSHNVFPEPLRVNPTACADSAECSPQQFEQNIRHLILSPSDWQKACDAEANPMPFPEASSSTTNYPATSEIPAPAGDTLTESPQVSPTDQSKGQPSSSSNPTATSEITTEISIPTTTSEIQSTSSPMEKLDESLLVGPTSVKTEPSYEIQSLNATVPTLMVAGNTVTFQPVESSTPLPSLEGDEMTATNATATGEGEQEKKMEPSDVGLEVSPSEEVIIEPETMSTTTKRPKIRRDPRQSQEEDNYRKVPISRDNADINGVFALS